MSGAAESSFAGENPGSNGGSQEDTGTRRATELRNSVPLLPSVPSLPSIPSSHPSEQAVPSEETMRQGKATPRISQKAETQPKEAPPSRSIPCAKEALEVLNCAADPSADFTKCTKLMGDLRRCSQAKNVKKFTLGD